MKLKKFDQYIKEDYSSEYDIESAPKNDGDDLTTQDDESGAGEEGNLDIDIELKGDGEDEEEFEGSSDSIKSELSKLGVEVLKKIASGEINIEEIASEILVAGLENDSDDTGYDEDDVIGDDEEFEGGYGDDDFGDDDFENLSLEESLKFSNFRKRK